MTKILKAGSSHRVARDAGRDVMLVVACKAEFWNLDFQNPT
jgi:hypothetical protein